MQPRPHPALPAAPCWLQLQCSGRKKSQRQGSFETFHSLPVPSVHSLQVPALLAQAHRVLPGPVGGAGVLPVTLFAQSSRAV